MSPPATTPVAWTRCRGCGCALKPDRGDDLVTGRCQSCGQRPETAKLAAAKPAARAFTDADRSLIRAMHGYLPPAELLRILNERMTADLGPGAPLYTLEGLHRAIGELGGAVRADDWSELRRLLAQARKSGVLEVVTPTVAEAFAVLFKLSTAQGTHLKDVLEHARGKP